MNYYEHHLGDYAEATSHLSILEDGVYSRLLRKIYASESALPADREILNRLVGARSRHEKAAVEVVLSEFFELRDDGFHNGRSDAEIARFQDKQRKAKASADARWSQTERNANASPNAMRTQCEGNALQSPDTSLHKEREPTALVVGTAYRPPPTPSIEIVELYREKLPQLPGVEVLNASRKRAISGRWKEVCTDGKLTRQAGLEWFAWFFEHAGKSRFLTGQIPGKSGRTWQADLDFLMTASKFPRVIEGVYHKDAA